jgi:ABC-type transporter Mla MlaB component
MTTDASTVRLHGELTIYQVNERYEELHLALLRSVAEQTAGTPPSLTIDTSELVLVDSAGLQLLVQLAQHARRAEVAIHWQTPSAALSQMISFYNAERWFNTSPEATP